MARVLADTGLHPGLLKLEITESLVMEDGPAAKQVLLRLKELGVRLPLDDFGTGYSSLSCLHTFPLDELKIDRAFVVGLGADDSALAVARAIATLAQAFGLRVVAEGVETEAQARILIGLGCDELQGYLYARPMPPSDLHRWLAGQANPVTPVEA